jgi:hypothetical protein
MISKVKQPIVEVLVNHLRNLSQPGVWMVGVQ